ncbi:hypothetical protein DY218_05705 [Streptomyces triticagri]|uniref:DUF3592 domain-containing protein n=1 Tax=Streptomyces triticagri TaxID=2293568 RepID=A0A372MA48_9ACTN|nr:hypothetical protein DY218_05705 [Streptomyces triticagri]
MLAIWALCLFLMSPTLTFYGNDAEVSCSSVADAGWSSRKISEDGGSRSYSFDVTGGELPKPDRGEPHWIVQDRVESKCDRRRTTWAAGMALILAPAAVLAAGAVFGPRRLRGVLVDPQAGPRTP